MRIQDVLFEAQNYEAMFTKLLGMSRDPGLQKQIADEIRWAKSTLKKNDRIVWYLRLVKFSALHMMADTNQVPEHRDVIAKELKKLNLNFIVPDLRSLKSKLQHYLGMDVTEIKSYVWKNESPQQLLELFAHYEQEWVARKSGGTVQVEDGDEMILSYPGGKAWWLLDRGACTAEANAMGHCGNVPSERSGDRILSFRSLVDKERNLWQPHLTFILDRNGLLGEMKGRANEKPASHYHQYIVDLLKNDSIEGIKGGGYEAHKNFSLDDLDPNVAEDLIEKKPELASLEYLYAKEGASKRVLRLAQNRLDDVGLPNIYSISADGVVLESFDSYTDLNVYFKPYEAIKTILEYPEDYQTTNERLDEIASLIDIHKVRGATILSIVKDLPDDVLVRLGLDKVDGDDRMISVVRNNRHLAQIFTREIAKNIALPSNFQTDEGFIRYLREMLNLIEYGLELTTASLVWDGNLDSPVTMQMDFDDFLVFLEADGEDEMNGAAFHKIEREGEWLVVMDYDLEERWNRPQDYFEPKDVDFLKRWWNRINSAVSDKIDPTTLSFSAAEVADSLTSTVRNSRDENQLELPFESYVRNLQRLAGILNG